MIRISSYTIFIPFPSALQLRSYFTSFSSQISKQTTKRKSFDKGLRVLDIIYPKKIVTDNRQTHISILQDFLQTNSGQFTDQHVTHDFSHSNSMEDSVCVLLRFQKNGLRVDPRVLSQALSSCGSDRTLNVGIQVHCLAITTGFITNVYVGSCLITFYSKCGVLDNALKVFDEMPVRNVVSWTAIITGFAQESKAEVCLDLYHRMRQSEFKPNDFTLTSFLSACTCNGSLGQGRIAHCQSIHMGFNSHVHIANSLISMYSKCGDIIDALYIFEHMHTKDLVSWNSMINGYSQHGLASQAIRLFEEMKQQKMKPDAITFLGILSSCRHAGIVEEGWFYFNSMAEYGVKSELDHYSCIVDLLGRAGFVQDAWDFIKKMPISPNAVIWGSLLTSCRLHGNVWIGIEAAEERLVLRPWCSATHLQVANLYASVGCWDQAGRVRKMVKDKGMKNDPGFSWIEIKNEVYQFRAEDKSNPKVDAILALMDGLVDHMRGLVYVPEIHEHEFDCDLYGAI